MSVRGSFATPVFASLLILLAAQVALGVNSSPPADTPTTQPSVVVVKSPTTAPAEAGVVRVALKRLATIPRPETERPAAVEQPSNAPVAKPRANARPAPSVRPITRARPVVPAGQESSSQMPYDQSDGGQGQFAPSAPIPDGAYVYPVPAPYVYVPPSYVPMPPSEMSPADRDWNRYLSYGGGVGAYGYGPGYGYGPYSYSGDGWGDAYRFGFTSAYAYWRFQRKATEQQESVTAHALDAMDKGLALFKAGDYRQSVYAFKLASETNQGDAAARIYTVHALFATGRYREAMPVLKRAFELQPKIALLDYNIRDDYGRPSDFDAQLRALEAALAQSPSNVERLIMLGYIRYYSGQRDTAYEPLAKAKALDPTNTVVDRLLPNCTPPDVVLDRQKAAVKARSGR